MERVIVIGSGGAGKSTFSRELNAAFDLPLIHLDVEYWRPGWVSPPAEAWAAHVNALVERERWVMDGSFHSTLDKRLARADTVVFLDIPRAICLLRVIWRVIKDPFVRGRADIPEGCRERFDLPFYRWVWGYPEVVRPEVLKAFEKLERERPEVEVRVFGSNDSALRWLNARRASP